MIWEHEETRVYEGNHISEHEGSDRIIKAGLIGYGIKGIRR